MSEEKKTVGMFRTSVPGIGPYCVEFEDGEIISTRSEARQKAIAGMEQLQADRDALLTALKDVMKEGEHDGPCTNEYDDSGPCLKHILASETRDKNALDLISKIENRKQAESH